MLGTMMDVPLLVSGILRHAEAYHGDAEVVSATMEGGLHRYTYADLARRSRQLASALARMGLETGDRVGTLAWNDYRHMELDSRVSGSGFLFPTINPRPFLQQLANNI